MSPEELYTDEYLNQTEVWFHRDGPLKIKDMPVPHRRSAAKYLLMTCKQLALVSLMYLDEEPPAQEVWARIGAPQKWVRSTPLYRRLIQGGADPDQIWGEEKR